MKKIKNLLEIFTIINNYDKDAEVYFDNNVNEIRINSYSSYTKMNFHDKHSLLKKGWDYDLMKGFWFSQM